MPDIYSREWYLRQYGEDWAAIVRAEDVRLGRNSDGTYTTHSAKPEPVDGHWAAHPINIQ